MSENKNVYDLKFKKHISVYVPLIIFGIIGAIILLIWTKSEVFLYLNSLHFEIGDILFPYITFLGDGWLSLILFIAFLFISYGKSVDLLLSFLISTIFVQGGKRLLFPDVMRPLGLLGEESIHVIDGVNIHSAHSFPSGHTTTAMLIFLFIAMNIENKALKFACIILGFLGAYSRIYISQHFFTDVYAGVFIACFAVFGAFIIRNQIGKSAWYDRRIIS